MNFKTYLLLLYILFNSSIYSQGFWEKLNGPPGALITAFAINTENNFEMMVGTEHGRVFYTIDGGNNWQMFGNVFPERVRGLAFALDGSLIVGTRGVYRSTDNGSNWKYVGVPNQSVRSMTINKNNGYLFAGTLTSSRIYRSTDNGNIWRVVHNLTYAPNEIHIEEKSGYIFIGTTDINNNALVERSTDNGNNWHYANIGMNNRNGINSITSDTLGNLYAATSFSNNFYYSTNLGETWINMDTNQVLYLYGFSSLLKIENYIIASVLNLDDNLAFIIRSRDNGYNWEFLETGIYWARGRLRKDFDNNIYFGHWGAGVYKSSDFGESWEHISDGLNNAYSTKLLFDENEHLYAASWQGYMYKSTDKGMNWEKLPIANLPFLNFLYSNDKTIYASSEAGLYFSNDHGNSWNKKDSISTDRFLKLIEDTKGNLYAAILNTGLWKSTDKGATWSWISNNFSNQFVEGLDIDKNDYIYAGAQGGLVYKSTDLGESWTSVNIGTNSWVRYITVAPNGDIYASALFSGVYRSTNEGNSWQNVTSNLPVTEFGEISINNKNEVFISLPKNGLFYSNTYGNNWLNITDNIESIRISRIIFDKEGYIYLGTDESVFKSKDTVVTGISVKEFDELPSSYNLSQNYPNPFNPATTIKYQLPEDGFVILKVYDVLGKEVAQLAKQHRTAGSYTVNFDASNLSSGLYIYEIRVNDFVQQRKMIVLK